jgi:hypothetical protein
MATKGYQVLLTDKPALVPLLEMNSVANTSALKNGVPQNSAALAFPFMFGASRKRLPKEFQPEASALGYIIASDILGCGDEGMFDDIVKTFNDLTTRSTSRSSSDTGEWTQSVQGSEQHEGRPTKILMSYKFRGDFENIFFEKAATKFFIRNVSTYSSDRREELALFSNETWSADVNVFELVPR